MAREHVVFLAFANAHGDLPWLRAERSRLQALFEKFEKDGRCSLLFKPDATWDQIYQVLTTQPDDIAIFHFGGHAREGQLLLDSHLGATPVEAEGLAALLGRRQNLKLAFLNGCSTEPQVQLLLDAGVPAVIATARPIDDRAACDLSVAFYESLTAGGELKPAGGRSIRAALDASRSYVIGSSGSGRYPRDLLASDRPQTIHDVAGAHGLPWNLFVRPGAEQVERWDLFSDDPLYGLPGLPAKIEWPTEPYRNLNYFARDHARIFFGRGQAIRELYNLLTLPADLAESPIIFYYGQTGVGKTSVLAAGLLPRVETLFETRHCRRLPQEGLLGTLRATLEPETKRCDLGAAWLEKEHLVNRPLLVVLDQAEEAFTRPRADSRPRDEICELFEEVHKAFAPTRSERPRGRLILSFRKEWLAEFDDVRKASRLDVRPVMLNPLDRRGVTEAIEGPSGHFGLLINPDRNSGEPAKITLAEFIADGLFDTLADPQTEQKSPIAPTLQILLTRMWKEANDPRRLRGRPTFDRALYHDLKATGFMLDEVIQGQITRIAGIESLHEAVENGLLLDLLEFFTTREGTANTRSRREVCNRYEIRQSKQPLKELLEACKNCYLLADVGVAEDGTPAYRLTHDTLAPLVRESFRVSSAAAQIARRLLEGRAATWKEGSEAPVLERADLVLAEQGLRWMRNLDNDESRLLEESRRVEARRVADEDKRRRQEVETQRRLDDAEEKAKQDLEQRLEAEETAKQQLQRRLTARKSALVKARQLLAKVKAAHGLLRRAVIGLAALLLTVVGIAIFAGYEWNQANKQRSAAEENSNVATTNANLAESRRLAALSELEKDAHLDRALALALEALDIQETSEARTSLFDALVSRPEITKFLRSNRGSPTCAAFSPSGSILAVGYSMGGVGAVELRDMEKHQRLIGKSLDVADGPVTSVAFAPNGQRLVAGCGAGASGKAVVWNLAGAQKPVDASLAVAEGIVTSVVYSPDGKHLATGYSNFSGTGGVALYRTDDRGRFVDETRAVTECSVWNVAFSPDSKTLAAGCGGRPGSEAIIWGINPFGTTPAARHNVALDGKVLLWDVDGMKGPPTKSIQVAEGIVTSVAFSPDGKILAAGHGGVGGGGGLLQSVLGAGISSGGKGGGVVLWDFELSQRILDRPLPVAAGYVLSVAFSPDGEKLAAGHTGGGALFWPARNRQLPSRKPFSVADGYDVNCLCFSNDAKTLALAYGDMSGDGGVAVCEMGRRSRLASEPMPVVEGLVTGLAFSADGSKVRAEYSAGLGRAGAVEWLANGQGRQTVPFEAEKGLILSVVSSPDFRTVASAYSPQLPGGSIGNSSMVTVYDVAQHRPLPVSPLDIPSGLVRKMAFSPDGSILAVSYMEGGKISVVLCDVRRREPISGTPLSVPSTNVADLAFSDDGKLFAMARDDGAVLLWDIGQRVRIPDMPLPATGYVSSIAFRPGSTTLAVGYGLSGAGGVVFRHVGQSEQQSETDLLVPEGYVTSLVFGLAGKVLAAGYTDRAGHGGVVLWDMVRGERLINKPIIITEGGVSSVALSRDGKKVGLAYWPTQGIGGVVLWDSDLESWKQLAARVANYDVRPNARSDTPNQKKLSIPKKGTPARRDSRGFWY